MALRDAIASLKSNLEASGLLDCYQGYPTVPFNFPSTAIKDPDTGLLTYSQKVGLRGGAMSQDYGHEDSVSQTFYLGRAFLVQNQEMEEASVMIASELGAKLLARINEWGIKCGVSMASLSDLRATPQVKQDEKIAQALRAIASPNSPDIQTSYWYAEVIVSFSMKYYL
jgi:hypothetical protein